MKWAPYSNIDWNYRRELYKIFDKLSDNDLIKMYHILKCLGLSWFVLSYCIEILEDRNYTINNLPKRVYTED